MHRLSLITALTVLLALAAGGAAAKDEIFTITDPSGDAYGDGAFLYPEGEDVEPTDLDIVKLRATRVRGGTEFQVTFSRPVKEPVRRPTDGYLLLTEIARHGFYTVNVDIYVDIDRVPGSGRVAMLPGRLAEVHPDHAWEKAICLTPRPDTARAMLRRILVADAKREIKQEKGTVRREDLDVAREQVAVDVADDIYFPSRVHVRGPRIEFTVPDTFFGGPAQADWSYVVVVSGADLMTDLQTADLNAGVVGIDFSGLMIMPLKAGGSRYTFGSREPDVEMMPPLPDMMLPEGVDQAEVLRSFDVLAERPARIPGIVPAAE